MSVRRKKNITLQFPTRGLVRKFGFQSQAPYSSPDCNNVVSTGLFDLRERGGRRAGLVKEYASRATDSDGKVQLLKSVSYFDDNLDLKEKLFGISGKTPFYVFNGDILALNANLTTEAGDNLITEDGDNIVTGDVVFESSDSIMAAERTQKLYIADSSKTIVSGDDGTISATDTLTATGVTDWSSLGIDTRRDVVVITPRNGSPAGIVTSQITSFSGNQLVLSTPTGNGDCSYEIYPAHKIFDPKTDELSLYTSDNSVVPSNCPLVVRYRDRIVFAGGYSWYMSRQGDPHDFNFGADPQDTQRAVAGNNSDAGDLGEPITAMITHTDDYIVFGCQNSIWLLRGDPAFGGQIDNLSEQVGILNSKSWCILPDATIVFLGRQGLYMMKPGATPYPQRFSDDILPESFINRNPEDDISMEYDLIDKSVYVSIVPQDGSRGEHWIIDIETMSFWPISFTNNGHQPTEMYGFSEEDGDPKNVLMGGQDGYVRIYDAESETDDSEVINSYVTIGPFRYSGDTYDETLLTGIVATLDQRSADVDWTVRVGNDGQDAVIGGYVLDSEGYPALNPDGTVQEDTDIDLFNRASGTWSSGRNNISDARSGGGAFIIRLESSGRWVAEKVGVMIQRKGTQRL